MCIMFQYLFRWALVGYDHLGLVSFFWLWTLPAYANKNMSRWNMTPRKTEKRYDVSIDQPKIYWTTHQINKLQTARVWSKTNDKTSRGWNTFLSCTPKQTHKSPYGNLPVEISLWKSLVFWNVRMKHLPPMCTSWPPSKTNRGSVLLRACENTRAVWCQIKQFCII